LDSRPHSPPTGAPHTDTKMSIVRKIIAAAFPEKAPEIDLHGLRVPEALDRVSAALTQAKRDEVSMIRIICGKGKGSPGGRGVLREAVAGHLEKHGYKGRYRRVVEGDGLDGSIIVEIAEKKR